MAKKDDKKAPAKADAKKSDSTSTESSGGETNARRININAQYIKDLSFESPNAPASLLAQKEAPKIAINVDVASKALQENTYEVTLNITSKANAADKSMFVVELSYAGIFTIQGISENELEAILMIYCPSILFPFARRVIADTVRDGGFPPLMIDPIDFAALYQRQKSDQKSKKAEA